MESPSARTSSIGRWGNILHPIFQIRDHLAGVRLLLSDFLNTYLPFFEEIFEDLAGGGVERRATKESPRA